MQKNKAVCHQCKLGVRLRLSSDVKPVSCTTIREFSTPTIEDPSADQPYETLAKGPNTSVILTTYLGLPPSSRQRVSIFSTSIQAFWSILNPKYAGSPTFVSLLPYYVVLSVQKLSHSPAASDESYD